MLPDHAALHDLYADGATNQDVSALIAEAVAAHEGRFIKHAAPRPTGLGLSSLGEWGPSSSSSSSSLSSSSSSSSSPSRRILAQLLSVGKSYGAGIWAPSSLFGEETERELAVEVQRQQELQVQPPAEVAAEEVDLPPGVRSVWASGRDSAAWVAMLTKGGGAKPLGDFVRERCIAELRCIAWCSGGGGGGGGGGGVTQAPPPTLLLTHNCFVTLQRRNDLTGYLRLLDAFVVAPDLRT